MRHRCCPECGALPGAPCALPDGAEHTRRLPPRPAQAELVATWERERRGRPAP